MNQRAAFGLHSGTVAGVTTRSSRMRRGTLLRVSHVRLFINRRLLIALLIPVVAGVVAHGDSRAATAKGLGTTLMQGYIAYECDGSLCLAHPDGSSRRRLLSEFPWPQWD